jgi:invasion protein IalB
MQVTFKKWQRLAPVAALAVSLPMAAVAQDAPEAPAIPTAQWAKICNKNPNNEQQKLCLTMQEVKAETGQFIASAAIREMTGVDKRSFVVAVPPGMMIQPGLTVKVDEGAETKVPFGICLPNACYGELEVNTDFVASMKKGGQLTITVMNAQAKPVSFPITLAGFTKAYDGEGLDPSAMAKRQDELNKALQQRIAEERKRLKQQQEGAAE